MQNDQNAKASQTENKQKFSIKDALFGGGGGVAGTDYNIIYFGINIANTSNGPEQFVNVIYGDDRSIFSNMFPLISILFSYKDGIKSPQIRLNKRFLPGGSKAEILIPIGYSIVGMPIQSATSPVPMPTAPINPLGFDPDVKYQDPYAGIKKLDPADLDPDPIDPIQAIQNAAAEAESDESDSKFIPPMLAPKVKDASNVIPEEEFVATFDDDTLTEKIAKFMDRHGVDRPKQVVAPKKDQADPRTIEEVKKEAVDQEVDKIIKNAENIRGSIFADTDLSPEIEEVRPTIKRENKPQAVEPKAEPEQKTTSVEQKSVFESDRGLITDRVSDQIGSSQADKQLPMLSLDVDVMDAAKYLIKMFYATGQRYSCTRTKIGKLLSIVAFSYARQGKVLFGSKTPIFRYPNCGTAIEELLMLDRDVYRSRKYQDDRKPFDSEFNDDPLRISIQYSKINPDQIPIDVRDRIEAVFRKFCAYTQSDLSEILNPIVDIPGVADEKTGQIDLDRIRLIRSEEINPDNPIRGFLGL